MAKKFTVKENELKGRGKTVLKGDPNKPESAQHIIYFPGGSIELSRTENDEYWVHIAVHKGVAGPSFGVRESATGEIVDSKVDYDYPAKPNVMPLDNESEINHLAVRIKTVQGRE